MARWVRIAGLRFIVDPRDGSLHLPFAAGGVDDIVLNAGAGGSTLATDEVGTRHFQRIKIADGAADSSVAVPAPVTAPASGDAGLVVRGIERRLGATLSTTPLGISGVFTQAGQDGNADGVKYVQAVARADVASAASGFVIEEYDLADDFVDANFIRIVASATVSANTTTRIHGVIRARKWRVKYTNGGTAQATFTLAAAADDIPAYLVDSTGALIIGLLDSAGARISPALTGQLPAALVGGRLDITIGASPATVPISAASLPLPAGAATSAAQLPAGHTVDPTDRAARLVGQVEGRAAHDAPVAGNPSLIAGRANLSEPAVVADGDATSLWADLFGRLVVLIGHANPEPPVIVPGSAAGVSVIAAPGAGLSLHICKGQVNNDAATENVISLREGAAGTIRWTHNCAADGGGSRFDFGSRGWKLPANTALVADIGAATGRVNVEEFYIAA